MSNAIEIPELIRNAPKDVVKERFYKIGVQLKHIYIKKWNEIAAARNGEKGQLFYRAIGDIYNSYNDKLDDKASNMALLLTNLLNTPDNEEEKTTASSLTRLSVPEGITTSSLSERVKSIHEKIVEKVERFNSDLNNIQSDNIRQYKMTMAACEIYSSLTIRSSEQNIEGKVILLEVFLGLIDSNFEMMPVPV